MLHDADRILSPGWRFSEQARREQRLLLATESAARTFLKQMQVAALSPMTQLTAARVSERWTKALEYHTLNFDPEVRSYVLEDLKRSDLPDLAYSTAAAVLTTAAQQLWSISTLTTQLQLALDLDTAEVTQEAIVAAGFWSGLTEAGTKWISKVRTLVRTTSTGLDGWVTLSGIRLFGIESKRWVTRHDDDVRPTHAAVDGETIRRDEAFIVGGSALQYPGERGAPVEEVVNCRCVIVGVLRP